MRISRTNFYPILETEGENDEQSSYYSYENSALPEVTPEAEEWHAVHEPVANDEDYRPRFRSPALRSYDPGQYADGSWESHFYMAPNVRFTRTPDKVAAKIEEAAAIEVQVAAPVAEEHLAPVEQPAVTRQPEAQPEQLTQAQLLQRLRDALDDRRQRVEQQPAPAPAEPAPRFVQAVVTAATSGAATDVVYKPTVPLQPFMARAPLVAPPAAKPDVRAAIDRFAHLSDHAFFETLAPEDAASDEPTRPAVTVVRMPLPTPAPVQAPVAIAMPAPVEQKREEPSSVAALFRVVECRPATTTRAAFVAPVATLPAVKAEPVVIEAAAVPVVVPAAVELKPAPVVAITPAAVIEPVRETPSSVLSRARPFQVTLATPAGDTYEYPPRELLQEPPRTVGFVLTQEQLEQNAGLLESVLEDFGVRGEIIHVRPGPVVTLYEFEPAPGVKSSRVIGLADDIARSMSALSARVAVVPGRNVIGIELPNATRETVYFREMIDSRTSPRPVSSCRSASARPSAVNPSSRNSRRCRICSSPVPPARASRSPSTP